MQQRSNGNRRRNAQNANSNKTLNRIMNNNLQVGAAGGSRPQPLNQRRNYTSYGPALSLPGATEFTYRALGNTDEGREFSLVNLHPCGEFVTDACGIPDESQVSCVTPTFRGDSTIGMDPAYFETPPTLPASFRYDIQLVVLPIPEIDFVFRVRVPSLNTGWSRWVIQRTTYFSNNADGTSTTLATSGYSSTRMIGRGITVHFDAPELENQGRLIAGQIKPPQSLRTQVLSRLEGLNEDPTAIRILKYYLPQSETELMQQDPLSAQWEAKEGTYIPHRYIQPTQLFTPTGSDATETVTIVNDDGTKRTVTVPLTQLAFADSPQSIAQSKSGSQPVYHATTPTWPDDTGNPPEGSLQPPYSDWGFSDPINQYTSVQFFLGISNLAQLHIKTRLYLECEVHARNSPVTPFLHKSPTLDPRAMQCVAFMAQNQQHVFFARDNDLGSILASIGKVLPGLLNALEGSGLPFVSGVGSVGNGIGRSLKGLLSGF